jgi:hypothetical protein
VKVPWPYPPLPEYVFRTMERSLEDMTYHENRRMFEDIPDSMQLQADQALS